MITENLEEYSKEDLLTMAENLEREGQQHEETAKMLYNRAAKMVYYAKNICKK